MPGWTICGSSPTASRTASPGYHTNGYFVRNDSAIKTVEDLKGKVIATNQRGSAVDMAVRAMLAKHNMQDKRDVTIIEVRFPDQKAMLKEGKVDLVTTPLPFGVDPELLAFAHPLFTQVDAIGRSQMIVRVARDGFLKAHRAEMVDFMEDYLRALHYLSDPANHAETVALIAQVTKQKPALFEGWAFTKDDYYRDPAALPDLDALQANIDLQHKLGFLRIAARRQEIRRSQHRQGSRRAAGGRSVGGIVAAHYDIAVRGGEGAAIADLSTLSAADPIGSRFLSARDGV